jgi:Gpi18-like mannosyltransferase
MSFWDSLPRWAKIWLSIALALYLAGIFLVPAILFWIGAAYDLAPVGR